MKKINLILILLLPEISYGNTDIISNFLHDTDKIPNIFINKDGNDRYNLDLFINKKHIKKIMLDVNPKHPSNICIPLYIIEEYNLEKQMVNENNCYKPLKDSGIYTKVSINDLSININIPQALLKKDKVKNEYKKLNSGYNIKYNTSYNINNNYKNDYYYNLSGNVNFFEKSLIFQVFKNNNKLYTQELYFYKDIPYLSSDVKLGSFYTSSSIIDSFNFRGIQLKKNIYLSNDTYGYAPLITGFTAQPARIVISQNGYILHSEMLPQGNYIFDKIKTISNGDIIAELYVNGNVVSKHIYPVTQIQGLLSYGQNDYNLGLGINEGTPIIYGDYSAGLKVSTLQFGGYLSNNNQLLGIKNIFNFGYYGSFSQKINISNDSRLGFLSESNYISHPYHGLNIQFKNELFKNYSNYTDDIEKNYNRFTMQFNYNDDNSSFSIINWIDNDNLNNNKGISMIYNSSYKKLNYSFNFSRDEINKSSISINLTLPFDDNKTILNTSYYSSNGFDYITSNYNSSINDQTNIDLSTAFSQNENQASLSINHKNKNVNLSSSINKSKYNYSLYTQLSGTIAGTYNHAYPIFTSDQSDNIAIVKIPNLKGVKFNNSNKTNDQGYTIVSTMPYRENLISIDYSSLPTKYELQKTSYNIKPLKYDISHITFNYKEINQYILEINNIDNGTPVFDLDHNEIGFIFNNICIINVNSKLKNIYFLRNEKIINIDLSNYYANVNRIQKVNK